MPAMLPGVHADERAPWHARMATTLYMPALGASLIIFALCVGVDRARGPDAPRAPRTRTPSLSRTGP